MSNDNADTHSASNANPLELARIKRDIFDHDPHHLIWGSIACRELWMWSDESGNGLGLDVTMKEAYFTGVGGTGLAAEPPAARSDQSVSTLRDFPMTYHALVDMPSTQMPTAGMLRSRLYNAFAQQDTAHSNYFVFNNNEALTTTPERGLDAAAAELQELLPALLTRRHLSPPPRPRSSPMVISASGTVAGAVGGNKLFLSARVWEES